MTEFYEDPRVEELNVRKYFIFLINLMIIFYMKDSDDDDDVPELVDTDNTQARSNTQAAGEEEVLIRIFSICNHNSIRTYRRRVLVEVRKKLVKLLES